MSVRCLQFLICLLCSLATHSNALFVDLDSSCLDLCKGDKPANSTNDSFVSAQTQPGDIVCNDWELAGPNSTNSGRKFRSCLGCESTSSAYNATSQLGDVYWFLYNMKATVALCVFGYPDSNQTQAYTQCNDICSGDKASVQTALVERTGESNATLQYNYCKNGAFQKNYGACKACLNTIPSTSSLSNYLHALNDACIQHPPPASNSTISLDFDLFPKSPNLTSNTTNTNSTPPQPEKTITVTSSQPTSPPNPTPPAPPTAPANKTVKIAIGFSIPLALGISGLVALVLFNHRKHARREGDVRARLEKEYEQRWKRERAGILCEMAAVREVAEKGDGGAWVEVEGRGVVEKDGVEVG